MADAAQPQDARKPARRKAIKAKPNKRTSGLPKGNGKGAPVDRVERWPISKLVPYASNPRLHSPEQVDQIAASMTEYGQAQLIIVDEGGEIIAGHGRVMAAQALGWKELKVGIAVGWSKARKRAYRIADNQIGLTSVWDTAILQMELTDLKLTVDDIGLLGFRVDDLAQLKITIPGMPSDDDGIERGKLLDLVNVVIGDPQHVVQSGDHYKLSDRHDLICIGVIDGWQTWKPLLEHGCLFCPYPGVFVPFSERAKDTNLLMVQPDPYIAGHILDRYAEVYTKDAIKKIAP